MRTIFMGMAGVVALAVGPCAGARAEETGAPVAPGVLKIEEAKAVEGVFVTYTGFMTTVLELKDGKCRYWFESDMKDENGPRYPVEGTYSLKGNVVTLTGEKIYQPTWTFLSVGGTTSLWRPDAMATKDQVMKDPAALRELASPWFKVLGGGSVLVPWKRSAEEAWARRGDVAFPRKPAAESSAEKEKKEKEKKKWEGPLECRVITGHPALCHMLKVLPVGTERVPE